VFLTPFLLLAAAPVPASFDQVKAEPNLERCARAAVDFAAIAERKAEAAFSNGDMKEDVAELNTMKECMEMVRESLVASKKTPGRNPELLQVCGDAFPRTADTARRTSSGVCLSKTARWWPFPTPRCRRFMIPGSKGSWAERNDYDHPLFGRGGMYVTPLFILGQQPKAGEPTDSGDAIFSTDARLVPLNVAVKDKSGRRRPRGRKGGKTGGVSRSKTYPEETRKLHSR
jgi:hypothetical protein